MNVPRWHSNPVDRRIGEHQIHVWRLDLDEEDAAGALLSMLAPDERDRAARRRSRVDARRYAMGRAMLRAILSLYTRSPARSIRLMTEARGRPVLDPPTEVVFSVSRSGATGLVAVARARAIGVDLEPLRAAGDIAEVADSFLPPERIVAIRAARDVDQAELWVGLWTEVEACAKADGTGLVDAANATRLLRLTGHRVRFRPLDGWLATLAYDGPSADVSYRIFAPPAIDRGTTRD
jgi:4'-phosphopantetheinyl transferase